MKRTVRLFVVNSVGMFIVPGAIKGFILTVYVILPVNVSVVGNLVKLSLSGSLLM